MLIILKITCRMHHIGLSWASKIMELTLQQFKSMLELALTNIKAKEQEFSELDAIAGDGDHGTAIVAAMNVLVEQAQTGSDFCSMLNDMGMAVMMQVSGSTSTLLGAFVLGMGDNVSGDRLDVDAMKRMFIGGLDGVQEQTKARVGDKTIMDALIPAVEAIANSTSSDIKTILNEGAQAAQAGALTTVKMKANFGRARNLGDLSIGHPDAGATSWALIFSSFAQGYTIQ